MVVENELYADLIIEEGRFSAESSWIFTGDEPISGDGALLDAARKWAGNIGEPLKIPAQDGRAFSVSEEFKVTKIKVEMIDRRRCRIRFTAAIPVEADLELGGESSGDGSAVWKCGEYREERQSDGSVFRTGSWKFIDPAQQAVFPEVGQIFEWEGGSFSCTACEIDLLDKSCKLTARKTETQLLNGIAVLNGRDDIAEKEAVWFVTKEEFADFQEEHTVGAPAVWAGEHFYLYDVDFTPYGNIGFEVKLKSREVLTRQLSITRQESLAGVTWNGIQRKSVAIQTKYQLCAEELEDFRAQLGSSPEWAESGMIVSDIQEEKRSDKEYIVTLEARYPKFVRWDDDNEVYEDRVDHKVDVAELFISPAMAGYVRNADGVWEKITDWKPAKECPFAVASALPLNYVNSVVRCMEVTVIEYIKGSCRKLLNDMQQWSNSRLDNGTHISGNALRIRQTGSDVREKDGTVYAKLSRTYQLPPSGMTWNSSYWSGL